MTRRITLTVDDAQEAQYLTKYLEGAAHEAFEDKMKLERMRAVGTAKKVHGLQKQLEEAAARVE